MDSNVVGPMVVSHHEVLVTTVGTDWELASVIGKKSVHWDHDDVDCSGCNIGLHPLQQIISHFSGSRTLLQLCHMLFYGFIGIRAVTGHSGGCEPWPQVVVSAVDCMEPH